MSEPTDHAARLRAIAGRTVFVPTSAGEQIREAADEIDRLRAELTATTRRAELAEEALRGEYQSRDHPRPRTPAAPF